MYRGLGKVILITLLLAIGLPAVGFALLCFLVDGYGQRDRARPADAIVILGARVLADGTAGPDLMPRTERAVTLFHKGMAPYIICSGGVAGDPLSAAAVACRTARQLGAPAEALVLADGSRNTREDAIRTEEIMRQRGWGSVIVVTHPLHLLRTTLLFQRVGLEVYPSPTSTEVGEIALRWRAFYSVREAGLITFDLLYPSGQFPDWVIALRQWMRLSGLDEMM